ncbi:MAG: TrgA family protein [Pseudomonadota bacterium]
MPTGTKLVSALVFLVVAYVAAQQVRTVMPEESDMGWFSEIMAVIGLFCGWIVMGKRAGDGWSFSLTAGLLTSVAIAFWGLLLFSIREMLIQSTRLRYDDAMEAILAVFEIAIEHGAMIAIPGIILTLVIGGLIGGYAAEWASRRYS